MLQKDNTLFRSKFVSVLVLAPIVALTLSACGDKKSGPPDDEGDGVKSKKVDCSSASFTDCAASVLASTGLMPAEKAALSGCDFDSATSQGTPADQFEVAKQAVKQTCQ